MGGTKFRFPEICRTWFVSMNSFFFPLLFFFIHLRDHPHTHTHTRVRVYICEPNRRISRYKITRPQGYPELIEQERGKTFGSCGYRKEIKTVVSGLPPPFLLCMQPLHLSAHHALRIARISGSFFSSFSLSLSLSINWRYARAKLVYSSVTSYAFLFFRPLDEKRRYWFRRLCTGHPFGRGHQMKFNI